MNWKPIKRKGWRPNVLWATGRSGYGYRIIHDQEIDKWRVYRLENDDDDEEICKPARSLEGAKAKAREDDRKILERRHR